MKLNKVTIAGNLTRDPEIKKTPNGITITKLTVAVNESYKDRDGNKKESTVFVDVDAFGKLAEIIGDHFKKGRPIYIEGRLKLEEWTNAESQKRSKLSVAATEFQFLDSGKKEQATSHPRVQTQEETDDSAPF